MPGKLTKCKINPKINTRGQALYTFVSGDTASDFSFAPGVLTDTMAEQYYSGEN